MNDALCYNYPILLQKIWQRAITKEPDIRIAVHVYDALKREAKKVMICTVDTDVWLSSNGPVL